MTRPFEHKDEQEGLGKAASARPRLSLADFLRGHVRELAVIACVLLAMVAGSMSFNAYLGRMFFQEGSETLAVTYKQVAASFEMFANRNWTILETWENNLKYVPEPTTVDETWDYQAEEKESWHYSDFYLFNENSDFITAFGRSGTADSITDAFKEMYETGAPLASSYIATSGDRKIVFAQPLKEALDFNGTTYTGVAISYDNDYVQGLVTADVFSDSSDCYVVNQDGDVIFSLAPKTVFTDHVYNILSYLDENTSYTRGSGYQLSESISSATRGSALVSHGSQSCYVVTQPAGIYGWSIVGVVDANVVDAVPNNVKHLTTAAQVLLAGVMFAGATVILVMRYNQHLDREEKEQMQADRQRLMTMQLLHGMTEMADRIAIVDLTTGTYEYHEYMLDKPLYPEKGSYDDFLEHLTRNYAALTEGDYAKMARLLNVEVLREKLKGESDRVKIEYASRTEHVYMLMTVIPIAFAEDGTLERMLLIGQDIGLRKQLESAANTDDLTGLFNERYFVNILHIKQRKNIPFVLFNLDLDKFKPVNDTYGHDMGDRLLRQVSERLQSCVRTEDFAFRIGGDEFALVITGEMEPEACEAMKKRVQEKIAAPYRIDDIDITIGASCGYAAWPSEVGSIGEARLLADERMYESKSRHHKDGATR